LETYSTWCASIAAEPADVTVARAGDVLKEDLAIVKQARRRGFCAALPVYLGALGASFCA